MTGVRGRTGDTGAIGELVPVGTPIDLDNCAREPIHIPGLIQPRGVLLAVREPGLVVSQASLNLAEHVGVASADALGAPLADVLGAGAAAAITHHVATFGDLRYRNPLDVAVECNGEVRQFDAILHRSQDLLIIELEIADGPRPFSFPNTYQAVRGSIAELNRASTLAELFQSTASAVRELTGFDRVMVYRYDDEYNGEVVAEDKREDLNAFLGLHYPASDIPAQARALYEKSWIRLISDIDYVPVGIVPTDDPATGQPLDLTHATLRSVSPIHVEYLQNMGVGASMSISLLRDGRLWGLIACHHYSGPHTPPFGVRAAAEFLGSTLSLRLVDRYEDDDLRVRLETQSVLNRLTTAALSESQSVVSTLLGSPGLLDLVPADGVVVRIGDETRTLGLVPERQVAGAIVSWALGRDADVSASSALADDLPGLVVDPAVVSGALVMSLPDGQYIAWTRREVEQAVDWGGDPHNKAIAVQEGDSVRLSPRRSFERWQEVVRGRSLPWTPFQVDIAAELRRHVVESLYARARTEVRLAETLQRSLLPDIPQLTHWSVSAHYEPAAGGRIGGDWYDAFELRDGRLVVVLGDVAGHGIGAAGTMAQLRNALRAYLIDGNPVGDAMRRLNGFVVDLVPGAFATVAVAVFDQATGATEIVSAGHPPPFHVRATDGAGPIEMRPSPPLGVLGAQFATITMTLPPGDGLVLYSDGLIERRDENLDAGLDRLAGVLADLKGLGTAERIFRDTTGSVGTTDDATVVAVHRPA